MKRVVRLRMRAFDIASEKMASYTSIQRKVPLVEASVKVEDHRWNQ